MYFTATGKLSAILNYDQGSIQKPKLVYIQILYFERKNIFLLIIRVKYNNKIAAVLFVETLPLQVAIPKEKQHHNHYYNKYLHSASFVISAIVLVCYHVLMNIFP